MHSFFLPYSKKRANYLHISKKNTTFAAAKVIKHIITMRPIIPAFILSVLLLMPCMLYADEVEIVLTEVVYNNTDTTSSPTFSTCSPDNLSSGDGSHKTGNTPPCKTCFRATINNNILSVSLQEWIPSAARIIVANVSGRVVLSQQLIDLKVEKLLSTGVYILRIETDGGALVGHFVVQ